MRRQTAKEKKDRFTELGGKFEDGKWIAWKFVTSEFTSPNRTAIALKYPVGRIITDHRKTNSNPNDHCGAGINLHAKYPNIKTLYINRKLVLLECRIEEKDILCIPHGAYPWSIWGNDYIGGPKFRVKKVKVIAAYRYDKKESNHLETIELATGYERIPPEKKSKGS